MVVRHVFQKHRGEGMLVGNVTERVTGGVEVRVLASSAGRRDAESFRQLVDVELNRSYRLAAVILRDPSEAEDAVHDAAVVAWRAWHSLRDGEKAAAWFQRIVVNTCRDRLRRRKRRSLLEAFRFPDDPPEFISDASDAVARSEQVREAIQRLSADERIAITLRYVEDMTVPAIAALLTIPEGTVKSRLHNATRRLRAALGEGNE